MTPDKIIAVIEMYERRFIEEWVPKLRMDPKRTFESLNKHECLAHAHFLCEGAKIYAADINRQRKAGSHLTAIQMCLSFAGWYTLEDIMNHNTNYISSAYRRANYSIYYEFETNLIWY